MKEVKVDEADLAAMMAEIDQMITSGSAATPPAPAPVVPPVPAPPPPSPVPPPPAPAPVAAAPAPVPNPPPFEPTEEPEHVTVSVDAPPPLAPVAAPAPVAAAPVMPPAPPPEVIEVDDIPPINSATPQAPVYSAPVGTINGLGYVVDVKAFQQAVAVSEVTLDEAMMQQAGKRAYYGHLAAQAEAQLTRTKAKFEVIEAKLYDHHRKLLATAGEKTTDKAIEAAVKMDPRWLKARELVADAEAIAGVNKGFTYSLADHREMLTQLGNDRRADQAGQLRILNTQEHRTRVANLMKEQGRDRREAA